MFGMGFMEIMIIAIIAILFLGPDKLPETMVNIAKFFRSMKSTVATAKESLEQEMNISELKQEALSYKNELMSAGNELEKVTSMANLDNEYDYIHDTVTNTTIEPNKKDAEPEPQVTFKKKSKPQKNKPETSDETADSQEPAVAPENKSEDKA